MNTILNTCLELKKKQVVMQDSQLDKLNDFRELLEKHKALLANSKLTSFFF